MPYPAIHQVSFAIIMLCIAYRLVLILQCPRQNSDAIYDAKYYIITGSLMFILAFGIWNVDNVFCDTWTTIRTHLWSNVAVPSFETPSLWAGIIGAVTQGHAWWHLLTGLGCARIAAGASCTSHLYLRLAVVSLISAVNLDLVLTTSHPDTFVLHRPLLRVVPSIRKSPEFLHPEAEEHLLGECLTVSMQEL
jgi:hypothetical protein